MTRDQAQVQYLKWLAKAHPSVYHAAIRAVPATLGDLGWINFVVQAVAAAGSLVLAKKQADKQTKLQKQQLAVEQQNADAERAQAIKLALLDTNTQRAKAGLPPVDIDGKIVGGNLPTPPALAPFTSVASAVSNWGPWLLGGGICVAAFFILKNR